MPTHLETLTGDELEALGFARGIVIEGMARSLRERARVSQGELARALHVHRTLVSHWEAQPPYRLPYGKSGAAYGAMLRRWSRP